MDVQHEDKNMQRYLSKEGLANHLDVSVGLINKKLKELPKTTSNQAYFPRIPL